MPNVENHELRYMISLQPLHLNGAARGLNRREVHSLYLDRNRARMEDIKQWLRDKGLLAEVEFEYEAKSFDNLFIRTNSRVARRLASAPHVESVVRNVPLPLQAARG